MNRDFLNVIYTRRSVRKFTGEKVKKEDLAAILRAGMSAPSAVNVQPWAFVAVTDRDAKPVDKFRQENIHREKW